MFSLVSKNEFMPKFDSLLTLSQLQSAFRSMSATPHDVVSSLLQRLSFCPPEVFITLLGHDALLARANALAGQLAADPTLLERLPLFGIPYAVKDNIDVAGLPTTCGCPEFSYVPAHSAEVVLRLEAAGAILVGKTNLDQFATGLVGTRSPYGEVRNPFNPDYLAGGSSSGSAVAVALGLVAFALGTDTAGSGRVPAGFCNLVGIKPTPGLVSTRGVFPACKSLDCVSVLAHTVDDAWQVLSHLVGTDAEDAYSRRVEALGPLMRQIRVGLPEPLEFCGDTQAEAAFVAALEPIRGVPGVTLAATPFAPLKRIASLLYSGPWIAERHLALGDFFASHGTKMDPVVRQVIAQAEGKTAQEVFAAEYERAAVKRNVAEMFSEVDLLIVPTAPAHFTRAQVAAEPVARNSDLGTYTNFVNLLGLSALALPGPFRSDGLPAGITLIGPGGADHRLAEFARRIEPLLHQRLGTSALQPPRQTESLLPLPDAESRVRLAVVGAHLSGMPLNWQLTERGGRLICKTQTAARYRFYALPGTVPPKPGLVQIGGDGLGVAIEVEVWDMPMRHYGSFVAEIPAPLGIGTLTLADGTHVQGFLCEAVATRGAEDISKYGGWRAYRKAATATAIS